MNHAIDTIDEDAVDSSDAIDVSRPSDRREILLVEDNPGDADFIMDLLGKPSSALTTITHVATLTEALARLPGGNIDVVLLDLRLPDGSGVDCVIAIRKHASEIPIVVLTGLADDALALACITAGAQDCLSKDEVGAPSLRRSIGYAIARAAETTQRRRAEALQQRLAAIVEASQDAIVSTNVAGRVTSWNPGATRIFGFAVREAMGRPLAELIGPADDEGAAEQGLRPARTPEGIAAHDVTHVRKDAAAVTVSVVVNTLRNTAGTVVGFASIYRDVTERRQMEAQLAVSDRMVSVGRLAAGVAHEINNPLAAVMMNLHLAEQAAATLAALKPVPAELMELSAELHDALEGAERIRNIVRDLKIFSRSEEEKTGPVNVRAVMESTLRMAWNEIRHRARLVTTYGDVGPVQASESRLGQVFLNLIVNAAQAIAEGDAENNEIRISTSLAPDGRIVVEVADTGPGIPPNVLSHLFTPFFTTKAAGVGTGLGLSISRRLVAGFGGTIEVDSEVGLGTMFRVHLRAAQRQEPAARTPIPVVTTVAGRRGRVLVIDDEPMVAKAVARTLARHDVTEMTSASAALERLRGGDRFDVILCDLMMPTMSGDEFYEALLALDRAQAKRVIFLTGGAFTPRAREFLKRSPVLRLDKPFDAAQLRALVDERIQ